MCIRDRRAAGQLLRVVPAPVAEGALKVGGHVVVPKPLGPPLGSVRAAPVVLMMRFEKRHKHEERPLVVRLVLEGLDGQVGDGVNPKACLLYTSDAADALPCVDHGGRRILQKKNNNNTTTIHSLHSILFPMIASSGLLPSISTPPTLSTSPLRSYR